MGSFTQTSGDLAVLEAHSESAHAGKLDKPTYSSPPSIFPSSHEAQALHPLRAVNADIKNGPQSREILMGSTNTHIDGKLDIILHYARDIHNICIYGKQDVYAKFSITNTQDTVYSTQPVRGGGKNPVFNQSLQILISKLDAVLKCELWMMSCSRSYLEDQLLGYVLVPLCELMGKEKSTQDYSLSSTDLFHTPAGMVCLSLMFYQRSTELVLPAFAAEHGKLAICRIGAGVSEHSELMENGNSNNMENCDRKAVVDYDSIEFPDLQAASENQQLVSMYMNMASNDSHMEENPCNGGQDLHGQDVVKPYACARDGTILSSSTSEGDCEMLVENVENTKLDVHSGSSNSASDNTRTLDNTGILGDVELSSPSTNQPTTQATRATTSKQEVSGVQTKDFNKQVTRSPRSLSSSGGLSPSGDNKTVGSSNGHESASSFTAPASPPLLGLPLNPEVHVVKQDIVDMYMKSMQQFTESLAKMKLPFDIDGTQNSEERSSEAQSEKKDVESESLAAEKDGHRVFYGSRAFF